MKVILIDEKKDLVWTDVPNPSIKDNEVLVEIHAAALNRADLMQRAGNYPPPEGCPDWMGLEISGTVKELGTEAIQQSQWKVGDKVCALLGGGGYAQYVAVRWDMLMPIPQGVTMIEAAAMPEAFATAYLNLFMEGGAKEGDTLLMHAGASGLASVVIPMAKSFGLRVITSVLSDNIAASISYLGADVIVNTRKQSIDKVLKEQLELGYPVDIAIDCLGGQMLGECLPYMARGGRWIVIATLAGDDGVIPLKTLYTRGIRLIGSTLRSRPIQVKAKILLKLIEEVWPKVTKGEVRPTIYRVLPMKDAEKAHKILENCENIGKVVLKND